MLDPEIKEYLLTIKPFQYLEPYELDMLTAHSKILFFAVGEALLEQGKKSAGMYIILKGKASMGAKVLGKGWISFGVLDQGNFVGEVSLIEKGLCTASVIANDYLQCMQVPKVYFDMLATFFPEMHYKIIKGITESVCERLKQTHNQIRSIMQETDISPRLAFVELVQSLTKPRHIQLEEEGIEHIHLKKSPFFKLFSDDEYKELLKYLKVIKAANRCLLIKGEDMDSAYYIVLRGAVQASIAQDNKVAKLAVLGPISMFGSISYVAGTPSIVSYMTCERTILFKISLTDLARLKKNNILLWYKLYAIICNSIVMLEKFTYEFYIRLNTERYNEI